MSKPLVTVIGKTVKNIAKLRGGGSALPGLVVERIDPNFISDTLSQIPMGIVVISGTNGKTTTTKMVTELLEGQGLKVFTNRTGSNFTRGVAAALLSEINIYGKLHADIAVLELDEAHAVNFVKKIKPRYSLLLNVMRDQLDRFGEIDKTVEMLKYIALNTQEIVVLNREDPKIYEIAKNIKEASVSFFGLNSNIRNIFPSDDEIHSNVVKNKNTADALVELVSFNNETQTASFLIGKTTLNIKLKLNGIYNVFNAAAAIALVIRIIGNKINKQNLVESLTKITPAFGREEKIKVNNKTIELILVKNPSGFQLALNSFPPKDYAIMIAINDNYADGRDMSWLWDVDFSSLRKANISQISGIRAYDMALRLKYDDVNFTHINPKISKALKNFLKNNQDKDKRIYCTYTAMLKIRREIAKIAKIKGIE
ncbi:MAG: MurT ligase domain-containing protein [Candidatus Saccharimonadales bacterium]